MAIADDGDFLLVWNDLVHTYGRHVPVGSGSSMAVELATHPPVGDPAVDMVDPGDRGAVVAWVSEVCVGGTAPCVLSHQLVGAGAVFATGFESGDLSDFCTVVGEVGGR